MAQNDINIKVQVDTTNAVKQTANYKQELAELKKQMTALQVETDGLTKATSEQIAEYNRLAQRAGTIQDALGDTAQQIKNLSNDFGNMQAALQGVGTAVAGISAVQGTMALFGEENEKAAIAIQKLNGLMVIMNSLNTISKALNKDSALMTALRTKSQKALNTELAKTNATETAGVGAMSAYTTGEAMATTGAITLKGAVKAVGTAIKSVPVVGWILAAIAALTTLISYISDANDEEERGNDLLEERKKKAQEINDTYKKNVQSIREENAELSKMLSNLDNGSGLLFEESVKAIASYVGVSEEYFKTLSKDEQENLKNTVLWYKETSESVKKLKQELDEGIYEPGTRAFQEAQQQLWAGQKSIASYEKTINAEREKGYNWVKKQEATTKALEDAEKARQKRIEESVKDIAELEKFLIEQTKQFNEETLDGKIANIDIEEQALVDMYDNALDSAIKYYGEDSEQVKQLTDLRLKALDELDKKRDDIYKQQERKELESAQRIARNKLNTELATLEEGSQEYVEKKLELDRQAEDEEKRLVEQQYADNLISYDEYLSQMDLITAEHAKTRFNINKEYANQIKEYEKQVQEARIDLVENSLSAIGDIMSTAMEAELDAVADNEAEQNEIRKKYAKAQFLVELGKIAVSTATAIMKAWEAYGEIPFVGPVLAGAQSAVIGAVGIAQTAAAHNAMNKALKAKRGGILNGKSHEQGGIKTDTGVELEGGEMVINKKSSQMFAPLLSSINSYNGYGAPLVTESSSSNNSNGLILDTNTIRQIVTETVSGVTAIPVYVTEHNITETQRKVNVIEQQSIL